ncbi:MAG: peptidoglycan DD-metalloendopeptidase family protein [Xanthomonadaceae bacterium]|nr:peptidoglycan DD-metalloendopeptidase family protein [Xanthomonadaceae bacterium]
MAAGTWLAGCSSNPPAPVVDLSLPNANAPAASAVAGATAQTYRVVHGDTLYSIAFKHGLDFRDLAAWNGIASPYRIFAGQELRLSAPPAPAVAATVPASAEPQPGQAVTSGIVEGATTVPLASSASASKPSAFEPVAASPVNPPRSTSMSGAAPVQTSASAVAPKPTFAVPAPKAVAAMPSPAAPVAVPTAPSKPVAGAPELNAGGVTWRWPADGKVVGTFVGGDQTKQGLDIAGRAGDPVRAAADGEVVYSGNGLIGYGELIIVKHNANFLSAYGHNSKRLVKEGDRVRAGQEIAEMGATSASRDELHFEIRKNGKPVNPLDYLPAK